MKTYVVSKTFFTDYLKSFLDYKGYKYTTEWNEKSITDVFVKVEVTEEIDKDIVQFLTYPTKIFKKESE